jgi:CrcB protein
MLAVVAVGLGGMTGALSRYGLDRLIEHHVSSVFPWSTFAINITGCFLAGLVVAGLVDRHDLPAGMRTGAVVGFLGAYTMFSTFAQESRDLLAGGHLPLALADTVGSVVVGVLAVVVGSAVGRVL